MEPLNMDASRIEQGIRALTARAREVRPIVMRWAVATVALLDVARAESGGALTWPEVGAVASRWLENFGRSTGQWKTHAEAALGMSSMDGIVSIRFDSAAPPPSRFDRVDRWISMRMQRYGFLLLRISLGVVFIWFGA